MNYLMLDEDWIKVLVYRFIFFPDTKQNSKPFAICEKTGQKMAGIDAPSLEEACLLAILLYQFKTQFYNTNLFGGKNGLQLI